MLASFSDPTTLVVLQQAERVPSFGTVCFFLTQSLKEKLDMSHHLDTPLARQNGRLYIDDLYIFSGNRSTVFVMDVNSTITGPDVQRGFHPEARYEFKVHFDGADFEDLT